jgi:AraC-like DNA-binding protein
MARPSLEPATPSALAPALLRLARSRGVDASLLALRCGLPSDAEARDEEPLTPALLGELLEACAEALGEPHLALSLPEALSFRRYDPAELSARASATLRDVLARTARYLPLAVPGLEGALEEGGGEATFRLRSPPGRAAARRPERHVHEYALAHALAAGRRETSLALRPVRAFFAHARPPDLAPLCRFFGTVDLSFGAESSGFVVPSGQLDAPTRGADDRLLATAVDLAEAALGARPSSRPASSLVAERLSASLPEVSLEAVAAALKMSPRTLQRRLGQEGTGFAEVLDGVRQELARRLVRGSTLPLSEIAFRLGFADLATFSRAFKRWTGTPPGTYRRS